MSAEPLLTIAIPTFNRFPYLKETLECVLPQKTSEIEIIVCDNHSEDDTWEYLGTLEGQITRIRHDKNVGLDRNFLSCLSNARGKYIWTLCDDDLPCSNAVESIVNAMRLFPEAGVFYLRVTGSDKILSNYDASPVTTEWTLFDADGFLTEVSSMFTFASSIIVKRKSLDVPFISKETGSALVPAAIVLSSVGMHNQAIVSDQSLLFARGDNTGGYNALIVFSKNIVELFQHCDPSWFSPRSINKAYNGNLALPLLIVVKSWPISAKGLVTVLRYSYRHSNLYRVVLPALARRLKRHIFNHGLT